MHELGIAANIVNIIHKELEDKTFDKVTAVYVDVGALTAIVPSALEFGFQIASQESKLAEARLVIREIPLKVECGICGKIFEPEEIFDLSCSECGNSDVKVLSGEELRVTSVEVD